MALSWIAAIGLAHVLENPARVMVGTWISYLSSFILMTGIIIKVVLDIRRHSPRLVPPVACFFPYEKRRGLDRTALDLCVMVRSLTLDISFSAIIFAPD